MGSIIMGKYKTRSEMANEYGVSRRTFYEMIKEADFTLSRGLITPKEQEKIYKAFGDPAERKRLEK